MGLIPVHLPILMYHQVMPKTHPNYHDHISVTPEILDYHITTLKNDGWKIQTLEEYFANPQKKVAILTFDDVCRNFIDYAVPVFEKHNVRANIYPIQNMTYNGEFHNLKNEGIPGLTEEEIIKLDQMGFRIGSHCQSHQNMHMIPLETAKKEMRESKIWLEGLLKKEVKTICYPIGGIDRDIVDYAREVGYKIGISTLKGGLQFLPTDIMTLRRLNIKDHSVGKNFKFLMSPFYGFRRLITRPFRAKYKVSHRHPDALKANS
ncbi:MAG: polysaccharide deacetylase family protein [Candidatus Caldatribacteriota bacterium]